MRATRRHKGIALILVLWIMVLLTLMAGSFAFERRTDAVLALDQIESIEADVLAEAAISRVVVALKQKDVELQPVPDGRIYAWRFGERDLRFAVVSENGKIDLNSAKEELIHGLFTSLVGELPDFDQSAANALAEAVLDWRDKDSDARPAGAEDRDYNNAGYPYEAADAPFVTIEELLRVMGMTESIYRKVADAITVYTRSGQIDPLTAPRRALLAVPDSDTALADEVIEVRSARESVTDPLPEVQSWFGQSARFLSSSRPHTFSIYAQVLTGSGHWIGRRAVVRLTGDKVDPYTLIAWFDHADLKSLGTKLQNSDEPVEGEQLDKLKTSQRDGIKDALTSSQIGSQSTNKMSGP